MTPEQKQALLTLLRIACEEENQQLDEGPLATLGIPTKGGKLKVPVILLVG